MSVTITNDTRALPVLWPSIAAIAAGLLVLVGVFWPECRAAVKVWGESTAYGHCYLVAPIAAYLAWDRREELRGLAPRAEPALLLLGLPLPVAWFASERLGIMEFRQFAAMGFVELLFLCVLGRRLFAALAGPLLYLLFMVPFGAFLTPLLQSFTARFVDVGLGVLGIPHFVTDMLIEVSSGNFFVAEACAGLRFLIASIAFGVFYALLNYRSYTRRAVFIAASIVVPIVANGIRALGIVVLGQALGSAEAAAADHLIYGWVFFSFVMVLLVAAGLPLREAPGTAPLAAMTPEPGRRAVPWPAVVVAMLAAVGPVAARSLDAERAPVQVSGLPVIAAPEGCTGSQPAEAAGSSRMTVTCQGRDWTVQVQAVSPHGTGATLGEVRSRMIGPVDAEEVSTQPVPGPIGAGSWTAMISRDPAVVTGYASWVRGAPARGGISQRVAMAVDSIAGGERPPLVVTISYRAAGRLSELEARSLTEELGRIVAAQPGLDAAAAALRVASSPPPRS